MATIRYLDALGATQLLDLVGESGMLPLDALSGSFPNTSSPSRMTAPVPSSKPLVQTNTFIGIAYTGLRRAITQGPISNSTQMSSGHQALKTPAMRGLEQCSGFSTLLALVIATIDLPIFQGEDQIEGNGSGNVLQGALGDDRILDRAVTGFMRLDGAR